MDLKTYREGLGLTQQQVAQALGLNSKSTISQLEGGVLAWPIRLALEVEVWSGGQVKAAELLTGADRALLMAAQSRAALEATA